MKIDTSKIENFDSMTADEKVAALLNYETPDTDKSKGVDDEINKLKKLLSNANSEAAQYKNKWKNTLDEKEKEQLEIKEALTAKEQRIAELEKKQTVATYKASYLSLGYSEEEATQAAERLADNDIPAVLEIQKNFQATQKQRIEAEMLNRQPQPTAGGEGGKPKVTPEQFDKMSYAERLNLFKTDKELYEQLKNNN